MESNPSERSVFMRRAGAYILDIIILFAILAPLGYVVQQWLGITPSSPVDVYKTLLLNFSIPVWTYFILSDISMRGATLGKRLLSIRTSTTSGQSTSLGKAFLRTAVKMIPWELTHASSFLLMPELGQFGAINWIGLSTAYALTFIYVFLAWRSKGKQSVHDLAAATHVCAIR